MTGRRIGNALAAFAIGVVVVAAALAPTVLARADTVTTLDGDAVDTSGEALADVAIGFWSPTDGVLADTETDDGGHFSMNVPAGVDGYVYAGETPDARNAVFTVGRRAYVRGVVGSEAERTPTSPLYQDAQPGVAHSVNAGKSVRFVLSAAGTLRGAVPATGAAGAVVQLARRDGSVISTLSTDAVGRFSTGALAPGKYRIIETPASPYLTLHVDAAVVSGTTSTVAIPDPTRGAMLTGVVRTATDVAAGVPVIVTEKSVDVATTVTDAAGRYRVGPFLPGDYSVDFGRYPTAVTAAPGAVTASSSTAPGAVTTATALGRVSDGVLPATALFSVAAAPAGAPAGDVQLDELLEAAAHIDGRVTGAIGDARVLLEDPTTSAVLRSTTASGGVFSFGGLTPGTPYLVVASDSPDDQAATRIAERTVTPIDTTTVALELARSGETLSGTVDVTSGTVEARASDQVIRDAAIGTDGTYSLVGLPPAAYTVTVRSAAKVSSRAVAVVVTGPVTQPLTAGPAPAAYKAWFISGGAGLTAVSGTATDTTGDVVTIGPELDAGDITVGDLVPGTYTYDAASFLGVAPTVDGPWWFTAPRGSFSLRAGQTTDVGPVILGVTGR